MALLRRRTTERDEPVVDRRADEPAVVDERPGPSPGIIRALFTLAGVAGAGLLLWLAQLFNTDATSGFWIAAAIVAGAGVALGLSQLFGGWTKWGWPTMSPMMFLFAFLPTLVVGGWILLAHQPQGGWLQGDVDRWTANLGLTGLVDALAFFLWVVPLVIGLVFAFSFDTTGPRMRVVTDDRAVPDEDVHDYRREPVTRDEDVVHDRDRELAETRHEDRSVAEELRYRDGDREHSGAVRSDARHRDDRI